MLFGRPESRDDSRDNERMEALSRAATAEGEVRSLRAEREMLIARYDSERRDAERARAQLTREIQGSSLRAELAQVDAARVEAQNRANESDRVTQRHMAAIGAARAHLEAARAERDALQALLVPVRPTIDDSRNVWELDDGRAADPSMVLRLARAAALATTQEERVKALQALLGEAAHLPDDGARIVEHSDRAAMLELEAHPEEGQRGDGPSAAWFAAIEIDDAAPVASNGPGAARTQGRAFPAAAETEADRLDRQINAEFERTGQINEDLVRQLRRLRRR